MAFFYLTMMKKYIKNLLFVILIIALISWLLFAKFIPQYYLQVFPFVVLFYAVISILIYAYQLLLASKDMGKFSRSIMLVTFLKLILYSAVAILYMVIDRENAKIFVVYFMFLYIVFTVFEVFSLLRITTSSKK
jgi:hypothetical protein